MTTTAPPQPADTTQRKRKTYAPPRVRSEKLLVPDLFTPSCIPDPETGEC